MEDDLTFNLSKTKKLAYLFYGIYIFFYAYLLFVHIPLIRAWFGLNTTIYFMLNSLVAIHSVVLIGPVLLMIPKSFAFPIFKCNVCGAQHRFHKFFTMSKFIEFILWFFFIFPGFIFSLYQAKVKDKCKKCKTGYLKADDIFPEIKSLSLEILSIMLLTAMIVVDITLTICYYTTPYFDKTFVLLFMLINALLIFRIIKTIALNRKCIDCFHPESLIRINVKINKKEIFFWCLALIIRQPNFILLATFVSFLARYEDRYMFSNCKKQIWLNKVYEKYKKTKKIRRGKSLNLINF